MMLANAPAVWIGKVLADRINMRKMRWLAAAFVFLMGIWSWAKSFALQFHGREVWREVHHLIYVRVFRRI